MTTIRRSQPLNNNLGNPKNSNQERLPKTFQSNKFLTTALTLTGHHIDVKPIQIM
jgi:hypothetical protein